MHVINCNLRTQPLRALVRAGNKEIALVADTLRHLAVAAMKTDGLHRADDVERDLRLTQETQDMSDLGELVYRGLC